MGGHIVAEDEGDAYQKLIESGRRADKEDLPPDLAVSGDILPSDCLLYTSRCV